MANVEGQSKKNCVTNAKDQHHAKSYARSSEPVTLPVGRMQTSFLQKRTSNAHDGRSYQLVALDYSTIYSYVCASTDAISWGSRCDIDIISPDFLLPIITDSSAQIT